MNKVIRKISLIFFLVSLSAPLFSLDFQGIMFADYYGDIEYTTDYENIRSRFYFNPIISGNIFNYAVDFEISANLFYDPLGDPSLIEPENILREAYLFIPLGNFDLSFGQKFVSPGMTDIYSPLNNINGEYAYKLSLDDPYDGKRADLMVQIQYYPDFNNSIQLVYVPFPRPDYEPTEDINVEITPDIDMKISFDADPYMLDNAHSFFLAYNHVSADFDFQLNYAFYKEQTPNFDIRDLSYGSSLTLDVVSKYTRNHTIGGAWGTSFNGYAFVEELAFNLTEDLDGTSIGIKNSDITLNSQIMRTLPGGTFAQLSLIYQYVINFNKGDTAYPNDIEKEFNGYFNQPVQHIAFAIIHLHNSFFHDKLYLALNAGYIHPNVYLAPRIAYTISDGMKIETGADINTSKPSDKFLARGNLLDNYYVRLKYEY